MRDAIFTLLTFALFRAAMSFVIFLTSLKRRLYRRAASGEAPCSQARR
jgi:hypothetical protein